MRRRGRTQRAGRGQDLPSHDRWLLSYADFVTLLLAVFIVLFATSWHNRRSLATVSTAIHSGFDSLSVIPAQEERLQTATPVPTQQLPQAIPHSSSTESTTELGRQLQSVLSDAISKKEIVVQQTPSGLVISLGELGFFNSGDATLLPGAAETLRKTAQVLIQHDLEVRVEGHSDDQPIHTAAFDSNWELSTARAMTVLSLLLDSTGFPPNKVSVAGYGPYHPVADNSTIEGRRMNRRVDLVVIVPKSKENVWH